MRLHLLKFFISLSLFATSFCKQSAAQSYCTTDLYTTGCGTNWIKEVTTYTSSILPSFSHTGSGCEASSGYVNFSDLYSVVQAAGSYLEFRVVTQVGYDGGGGGI